MRERLPAAGIGIEMLAAAFGVGISLVVPDTPPVVAAMLIGVFGITGMILILYGIWPELRPKKAKHELVLPDSYVPSLPPRKWSKQIPYAVAAIAIPGLIVGLLIFGSGNPDPCYAKIESSGEIALYAPGFGVLLLPQGSSADGVEYQRVSDQLPSDRTSISSSYARKLLAECR